MRAEFSKVTTPPTQSPQIATDEDTASQAYRSALRAAIEQGDAYATSEILSQVPANFMLEEFIIRRSIYTGPISVLQALLAHDRTLANTTFDRHGTPLSVALQSKRPISTIELLLSHSADPNIDPEIVPSSLCIAAAFYDDSPVVRLWLEHGANTQNSSALSAAASSGKLDNVQYLLARGCDPNGDAADRKWATRLPPLHLAVQKGHDAICEALLCAGADQMLKDGRGRRAIDVARAAGRGQAFEEWCLRAMAMSGRAHSLAV